MAVSVKATEHGLKKVDQTRIRKGWKKTEGDWCNAAGVSEATLKRFWRGEAIQRKNFISICKAVGLEDKWEELIFTNFVRDSEEENLVGREIGSRYKITKRRNSKDYCDIYEARDNALPDYPLCIVKKLTSDSDTAKFMFEREANTLYKLGKHNQITTLLAHFSENKDFYLVEEYIEGKTIAQEMEERPKWSETDVIKFFGEVLEVLNIVHENHVIHRNINPNNLIRRELDGKIVLVNFAGVRQIKNSTKTVNKQINTHIYLYSFLNKKTESRHYFPPEQVMRLPKLCSDIYSLGIIGVQAITGLEFKNLAIDESNNNIIWEDKVSVSTQFSKFLNKMICYDFQGRYFSAKVALQELNEITTSTVRQK